jgi:transposase InsO family protein
MKYAFIKTNTEQWSIERLCEVLEVSSSGYYDWLKRPVCKRAKEDSQLTEQIIKFHCGSGCTYGSPRIYKDLKASGYRLGRKRVERLMKAAAIRGKSKRKYKTTTNSKHKRPRAENLLKQDFKVEQPNQAWVSDITYLATLEGWLYLAVILDLYSRKVIGWAFSERLTDGLTLSALDMALKQRYLSKELIFHSDQGSQYASNAFQAKLKHHHIQQSMSGKGNCFDNAVAESFFATLKTEEIENTPYLTRQQAKTSIFKYIEGFYNTRRRHSTLDYLSPSTFEGLYYGQVT